MTQSRASRGSGSLTQLFGVALFGLASLATYFAVQFWKESDFSWGPGAMALLAFSFLALHLVIVWRRTSPLDPAVWLPMAIILFYFGLPVAVEGIGRGVDMSYDPWRVGLPINLSRGYCTAVLALVAYLLGIHLAGVRDLSRRTATPSEDQSLALPSLVLTIGAVTMLGIGVALVGPAVVFGTYTEWWDAKKLGADSRFVDMGIVFAQAGVFGLIASHHPKRMYRLYFAYSVAALLVWVAIQKGSRASLMATGVGLVWCYSQRVRRLSAAIVTVVVLGGVLIFPVLGDYRTTKRIGSFEDKTFRSTFARSIYEMGSSVHTLIYTMDMVPSTESYAKGVAYLEAAWQLIPNLGLRPQGGDNLTGSIKAYHSNWLTFQVAPLWAASGGGYGSSMAGELYFNFGVTGILLGCILIGYVSGRLRSSVQDSALKLTASALFFGMMVIYVRNPIGVPIKNLLWSLAALLIIRSTLSLLISRSASPRVSRPVQL